MAPKAGVWQQVRWSEVGVARGKVGNVSFPSRARTLAPKSVQKLLCVLRIVRERRNCAGGHPNSRLKTRLNAASDA